MPLLALGARSCGRPHELGPGTERGVRENDWKLNFCVYL